jgi:flavorubredoxin
MATITEIAPDIYRICVVNSAIGLQFSHFLVRDDEPLLFHAGLRRMWPEVRDGVAKLIDPAALRWISWSHFESDECGALNDWLRIAPHATPACGMIGARVNVNDFSDREVRVLGPQDVLSTGRHRFHYHPTPQLPHGWDAGLLFEETRRTLFCSDLFHQLGGDLEPLSQASILDRCRHALATIQAGPLAGYIPYTASTGAILQSLAALNPQTLAIQHGSSFTGNCAAALSELNALMADLLTQAPEPSGGSAGTAG